ncbi:copper amine oxidase N-terminal domain-containing protein [Paenibacillus xylanilyticus]|uniref:Copper amine oxidase N-terminal domain-containing protein n=1 Tax=Paenibacillus xylanilyticus TaxID=248903 RepID=A0A7Y6BTC5_9BACL|nr:copper amine oxidase N-terminal domain-containing protein [Paenibacillus xylanilyticus]NUU74595.1 copper amine oxidase N-terminal domain-containing protein [Paenibacillus xylanilyticus]
MKKKIIFSILTTVTVMTGALGSAYAAGVIKLNVNGNNLQTDVAPKMVNNRVMVPISFVSKALGASVAWNEKTQTVSINATGIPSENVWDENMKEVGQLQLASINNTVQVFLTGVDIGDEDLLKKSTTSLDVDRLKQEASSMGPTMLSTKIIDMKTIKKNQNGQRPEYLVRVGIQKGGDELKVDYWDLTVTLAPAVDNGTTISTGGKMEYVVSKRDVVKSSPVKVQRVFPGYTIESSK